MQHQPDLIIIVLLFALLLSSALLVHGDDQVAVCHIAHSNLENTRTLYVDPKQLEHYLEQGDLPGACPSQPLGTASQKVTTQRLNPVLLH